MNRNIFAVCDLEASYAVNLTDYMNEKRNTPFEVQAFTNVESLQHFARDHPIELLLISTRAMCEEIKELKIERIIILSEGGTAAGSESGRVSVCLQVPVIRPAAS